MKKILEITNGKKTTAAAIAFVALQIARMKYPNLLLGQDILVEQIFTIVFGSTLAHKVYRSVIDKITKKKEQAGK